MVRRDVKGLYSAGPRWPGLVDEHPYFGGERVGDYVDNVSMFLDLLRCEAARDRLPQIPAPEMLEAAEGDSFL